tara:strand:- start:937 stop:1197 length:261 start_codon:yes stop_codon:yes gene_type:complete
MAKTKRVSRSPSRRRRTIRRAAKNAATRRKRSTAVKQYSDRIFEKNASMLMRKMLLARMRLGKGTRKKSRRKRRRKRRRGRKSSKR